MSFHASLRRLAFPATLACLCSPCLLAQNPTPVQSSERAPISMEEEGHHHFVFENAYVKVYYVEIPPHDATLPHRHDLPHINLPPPEIGSAPASSSSGSPGGIGVSYLPGNFSHAMTNSTAVAVRNVAVELVRPQGTVRNRCSEALQGQPLGACDKPASADSSRPLHYTLFETDEIVVQYWEIGPNATIAPADAHLSVLVGGMSGITEGVATGEERVLPQAGAVWLLGGSQATLKAGANGGHFIAVAFKDSAPPP